MASNAGLARRRADRRPSRRPQAISRTSGARSSVTEFHGCDNNISSSCQPPSPRVQGAFRGRARRRRRRRCTRRRQRDSHCTQCAPLGQCAPPLGQCAPHCSSAPPAATVRPPAAAVQAPTTGQGGSDRPRNRDDGDSGGPQGDNDSSDGAAYGEKRGGVSCPPRFSPYLAAKQRRPPDASSASGAFARARARQNVRITERMEQRIGGGSAPDGGDPPVIRRHPAGDPRLSAPKRTSSVCRPPCRAA